MDDAIELCMLTSGQDCKALPIIDALVTRFHVAVARLPINTPSIFDFVYVPVGKRVGVRGDGSEGFLIGQTRPRTAVVSLTARNARLMAINLRM